MWSLNCFCISTQLLDFLNLYFFNCIYFVKTLQINNAFVTNCIAEVHLETLLKYMVWSLSANIFCSFKELDSLYLESCQVLFCGFGSKGDDSFRMHCKTGKSCVLWSSLLSRSQTWHTTLLPIDMKTDFVTGFVLTLPFKSANKCWQINPKDNLH